MADPKIILSLHAHPDDTEFFCAGTLALLHEKGWEIHSATMTPGDCGSAEHRREEISGICRSEAAKSANILYGTYHCLEYDDIFIMYDRQRLLKTIGLLRKIHPTIVFAPSPCDYMVDHETTSRLARTACFACGIPNIKIAGVDAFEPVPYLYYVDVHEGRDEFGKPIDPAILVDISSVMDIKKQMLCCHESQRNWFLVHHRMDDYIISMEKLAQKRSKQIGCDFAEGFRQHLGHGYPQDNILKKELGDLVHEI